MDTITLQVPGRPLSWKRPEPSKGRKPYKDAKTRAFQARVQLASMKAGGARFFAEGPVRMEIEAVFTNAHSLPDADNLAKGVMDALQVPRAMRGRGAPAAALYTDDRQVVELAIRRCIHRDGASRLRVTVIELPDGADVYRPEKS